MDCGKCGVGKSGIFSVCVAMVFDCFVVVFLTISVNFFKSWRNSSMTTPSILISFLTNLSSSTTAELEVDDVVEEEEEELYGLSDILSSTTYTDFLGALPTTVSLLNRSVPFKEKGERHWSSRMSLRIFSVLLDWKEFHFPMGENFPDYARIPDL